MNQIKKHWIITLSLLFVLAMWCYWGLRFPALLVFKEQTQMFLFTSDYFTERVVFPAGVSRYVAEFLVQFFNNVKFGALVVSVLLLSTQLLTWSICRRSLKNNDTSNTLYYYISFIPTLVLAYFMGNENLCFTFPVAIVLTLVGMLLYTFLKATLARWAYVIIVTPLLYWAVGPVVLMFPVFVAFVELTRKQKVMPIVAIVYVVAIIWLSTFFVKAPSSRILLGINYSLLVTELMPLQIVVPACFVLVIIVAYYLPAVRQQRLSLIHGLSLLALFVFILFLLPMSVEKVRYEVFEYDNLVRQGEWDAIIKKAEKKAPTSPLSVASLNLALAMNGQLTERYAQFYQNGPQGAFPLFNKNFLFSLMTSEVYFNVGLVNTAQRFAFEAMETIPDNNKSARIIKRLAQTNIINGQYEVARKYLHLLEQTLFYRNWAKRTEKMLYNENAINADPLYGYMRKVRLQNDFFFSEPEIDKIMGQLVMQSTDNVVAQRYLLLMPLLEGNRPKYEAYRQFLEQARRGEIKRDSTAVATAPAQVDATTSATQLDGRTSASPKR